MSKYLNIYAFCKVIKGQENYVICDFQKKNLKHIPDTLALIIEQFKENEFVTVKNNFIDQKTVFNSYVNYLTQNKFAFFSDYRDEFIDIKDDFETPEIINNAILEYDFNKYNIISVLEQLDELFCKYIEIRILNFTIENLNYLADIFETTILCGFRSIVVYLPYSETTESKIIYQKLKKYKKIHMIVFYNTTDKVKISSKIQNLQYIKSGIDEIRNKNFQEKNLIIDLNYFFEAQQKNPYYNKKVSIDYLGNVKNCIKNKSVFGNTNTHMLESIIKTKEFQEFWNVSHDKILKICNSELRYNKLVSNDLKKVSEHLYEIIE